MGRLRFVVGALGIVAGFSIYEYGFFLTLNLSAGLTGWTMILVPWIGSVEILGAALQLAGGVIAIVGLLICISWIGSQPRVTQQSIKPQRVTELTPRIPDSAPKCKFCGTVLESGTTFCPSCQRAQA
jgi:hypothetical protein